MAEIIILRGNSASGKSTAAKALQKTLGRGTFLISQDHVRREMLWVHDKPGNPAVNLLQHLILYGYNNSPITILDGILYSDIYESLFKKIKEVYTNHIHAYYFDVSFAETLERHKQKPIAHEFGETEMRSWWREKDYLPNICEKVLTQEMSVNEIVELIMHDVFDEKK